MSIIYALEDRYLKHPLKVRDVSSSSLSFGKLGVSKAIEIFVDTNLVSFI
jgi:hypothetical protein